MNVIAAIQPTPAETLSLHVRQIRGEAIGKTSTGASAVWLNPAFCSVFSSISPPTHTTIVQ